MLYTDCSEVVNLALSGTVTLYAIWNDRFTLSFPAAGASAGELKDFAGRYSIIDYREEITEDKAKIGTFSISDSEGRTLPPGIKLAIHDDVTFAITYYVEKNYTLMVVDSIDSDLILILTAIYDKDT